MGSCFPALVWKFNSPWLLEKGVRITFYLSLDTETHISAPAEAIIFIPCWHPPSPPHNCWSLLGSFKRLLNTGMDTQRGDAIASWGLSEQLINTDRPVSPIKRDEKKLRTQQSIVGAERRRGTAWIQLGLDHCWETHARAFEHVVSLGYCRLYDGGFEDFVSVRSVLGNLFCLNVRLFSRNFSKLEMSGLPSHWAKNICFKTNVFILRQSPRQYNHNGHLHTWLRATGPALSHCYTQNCNLPRAHAYLVDTTWPLWIPSYSDFYPWDASLDPWPLTCH